MGEGQGQSQGQCVLIHEGEVKIKVNACVQVEVTDTVKDGVEVKVSVSMVCDGESAWSPCNWQALYSRATLLCCLLFRREPVGANPLASG